MNTKSVAKPPVSAKSSAAGVDTLGHAPTGPNADKPPALPPVRWAPALDLRNVKMDLAFNVARTKDDYSKKALATLTASIVEKGIVDPIFVSQLPDGSYHLDAGFRRAAAASWGNVYSAPALVYQVKTLADRGRRERNATENSYTPPTWGGQAATATGLKINGASQKDIALSMARDEKYVGRLIRAYDTLTALVKAEAVHADAFSCLTFAETETLLAHKGIEATAKAWEKYVSTGTIPEPATRANAGGGRPRTDGKWNAKDGIAKLSEAYPAIYWKDLASRFPPTDARDVELVGIMLGLALPAYKEDCIYLPTKDGAVRDAVMAKLPYRTPPAPADPTPGNATAGDASRG